MSFLTELASTYSANAKTFTVGTSYQGRTITGINIFGSTGANTKPGVVIFGTIHAREWVTTMVRSFLCGKYVLV